MPALPPPERETESSRNRRISQINFPPAESPLAGSRLSAGDDTDSHIDTLARFCSTDTIAYVKCDNTEDEHYEALHAMEEQLKTFRTLAGEPYRLLALPMADKVEEDGERLPATYANFLIMNDAILYPTYQQPDNDRKAGEVLQQAFPKHQVIGIDCRALIKQHGSLHCVTMQYPSGVIQ